MKSLVRLRYDDPLCPRMDISLRGAVSQEEAQSRLSSKQRSEILQLLSTPNAKMRVLEPQVDVVAGLIIRLERARKDRTLRKKKAKRGETLSVANVDLAATESIRIAASRLNAALQESVRAVRRIDAELRSVRKSLSTIESGYLLEVAAACKRARARIKVRYGPDEVRALSSVVHQLGSIWAKSKGAEPTYSSKSGSFIHFVNKVLDIAGVPKTSHTSRVRSVVEQREIRRDRRIEEYSDQDEASDNSYPSLRRK